ncbi:MAG TPA: MarR family winged helix-turn-helix transcriptional regulator [Spirochaetales bacterium]|nr:MarR family winged helix-turn-helix transcriptional regulator [Spirochaetales bacterium]HRY54926.1 MarR family winged helix-turn-helix transcriptional regulator [Spirochaetia bacterium]HRZ65272.1 MarR family winged helix-turn-helix transcriptional regulator [Spirochaetia bacterium]
MDAPKGIVADIRAFNRFYTGVLGLLDRHFLRSRYSLTEVRVLYELAHNEDCAAKTILAATGLDQGYLSRILNSFIRKGLLERNRSPEDGRCGILALTREGRACIAAIEAEQVAAIDTLVRALTTEERRELVRNMNRIQALLKGSGTRKGG